MDINWGGEASHWLEAIGTLGTFFFAGAVYFADRRRASSEAAQAEARRFVIWMDDDGLRFLNRTGFPVLLPTLQMSLITPGDGTREARFEIMLPNLPPTETSSPVPIKADDPHRAELDWYYVSSYSFIDVVGRCWTRRPGRDVQLNK